LMKTILVIEDDKNIRESIVDLLETSNFKAIGAPNGAEGIRVAKEIIPDLIICDVMMPIMDGYEVIDTIRKEPDLSEIPFIFLSAKSQKSDMRRGMDLGADDYLTKPFKAQELFTAVETRIWRQETGKKVLIETQEELDKINRQLLTISKADIPVSMIIFDLLGIVVHFSKGAERLLGYTAEEVVNRKPVSSFYVEEEIKTRSLEIGNLIGKPVDSGTGFLFEIPRLQSFESREWTFVRKDGSTFPVQLVVSPIKDKTETVTGFLAIAIDITERKAAEVALKYAKDQAELASKMKSQFLASMSHEIRTPMNAILGFSDILMNIINDPLPRNYLSTIISSGRTLMSLINDLLDLAKIEAGKMMLRPERVNLSMLINEVTQMFTADLRKKGIDIFVEFTGIVPDEMILDNIRTRQMIMNLLGNAVKFTHKGYVKVKVIGQTYENAEDRIDLTILVEDTGIGIALEDQKTIFESFQQVHDKSTTQYGGTGLGLSITRRLAELMDGYITVTSRKGEGSLFSIRLPFVKVVTDELSPAKQVDGFVNQPGFKAATILVVDDVRENLDLISGYVTGTKLNVITALNGQDGLVQASKFLPDLVLMDLRMPEMDGWEACKILKLDARLKNIPVVACTASLTGNENTISMFDGILTKPVTKATLFELLRKFLPVEHLALEMNDAGTAVSSVASADFADHRRTLQIRFQDRIREQIEVFDVGQMESLLNDLNAFAKDHDLSDLAARLQIIGEYVEKFDIDLVIKKLQELEKLLAGHTA
jgi:PAS domain S-box-containing protein